LVEPHRTAQIDSKRLDASRSPVRSQLRLPPYLLVGHSLGGLYARHYAQRFADEISGLLLLDPAHEDYNAYMPQQLVDQWEACDPDQAFPDELPD
jgi:pimeloyl-ACP methyl ester carboxylesterase